MDIHEDCYLECRSELAGYWCKSCGAVASEGDGYVPQGWKARNEKCKGLVGSYDAAFLYCPKCAGKVGKKEAGK